MYNINYDKNSNRSKGANFEQLAVQYLENKGYRILELNYRCRMGEIDIIAKDQDTLVFIEVKYRKNSNQGDPAEAVTIFKQM